MKQLSIFIENKGGTLIKVLNILSKAKIQIIASTVADTKDYGIYRILCDKQEEAFIALKEGGINVQMTEVQAIAVNDTPGEAAKAVQALSEAGVSILYMYSFLWKSNGVLVFRTDNTAQTEEIIKSNSMTILTEKDFA